ncbi:MAG: pyruvate kinase [Gammaproteobacteria bacterium]|nr:pyruvate kinase [Gammaproteobacteria bacterium]
MRRTKIVATLGPATDDPKVLREMFDAGLNVGRINFSHDDPDAHRRRTKMVRELARECDHEIGLMGDLQGPKIRIRRFADGPIMLDENDTFFLDSKLGKSDGNQEGVGVAYSKLHKDVRKGDRLLLNDGQIELQVESIRNTRINTRVVIGGELSDHKGINRQGGGLSASSLTKQDRENIKLAAELELDFLAVSFVRSAADVKKARKLLREAGGHGLIVAKIERVEAVENIDEIVQAADVIMVARGDLGVEMGYAELTGLQKKIIRKTRYANKVVITATQMMESMISNLTPTRAEVSDVANAVMDGTDAVMLSAETAVGEFPVAVISTVARVCSGAEKHSLSVGRTTHRLDDRFDEVDEAIAMAVMYTANHLSVRAIIALTESGSTTLWMSRIRSDIPIYAFTPHIATSRRVTMYRGVYPVRFISKRRSKEHIYEDTFATLKTHELVDEGDLVIYTRGDLHGVAGATNTMKIIQVSFPNKKK